MSIIIFNTTKARIKNPETEGAKAFAPYIPNTIAASEATSFTRPLNNPKIKPITMGIKINRSKFVIKKIKWFECKGKKKVEI